jgi:hypothetical protein
VKGSQNQTIGQVLGGVVVNNLTIYERVSEASLPPPIRVEQPLTQQESRHRKALLNKVKEYWIKGVLEKTLHNRALISLGLQERIDLVQRPFKGVGEFPEAPGHFLPEGIQPTTVFEQMGEGRTLLILGEPGAGKTNTLLKLAEDLIVRTEPDLRQPIPVVFNLSSWTSDLKNIEQWLVQDLYEKYEVSEALGKDWIKTESLILLLDGLDEVKAEQRNACVQALNHFIQTHGTTEIAICCRIRDYQALTVRLKLRSAICIQPLTPKQINSYFEQVGEPLSALKKVLQEDRALQELATSPLILSIMSLAYEGCTLEDITLSNKTVDYRKRLFENYIERMFQRRGTTQQYPRKKTERWLIWLAQHMAVTSQTIFLIERLQPRCLAYKGSQIYYRIESGCIGGLIYGLIYGLVSGLIHGLVIWLTPGLRFSLIYGQIYWLMFGLSGGIMAGFFGDIKPIETLKWSWQKVKGSLRKGFIFGLIYIFIYTLAFWLIYEFRDELKNRLVYGLSIGLNFGVLLGLIGGLISGLGGPEVLQKGKPNQGIFRSAWNSVIIGMGVFGVVGLIVGLSVALKYEQSVGLIYGLIYGLNCGLIGGLFGGGNACIRHVILRFMLYRRGFAPWNYSRFLDFATERLFLQKVGGGYIFVHRMLLEHFAEMPLEREQHL